MRWYKHFTDNYRGRSVTSFHREFGHTGVAWYFLLTEICAEKLEKPVSRDIADADCAFGFDKAFIESSLRGTFTKIKRWLDHGVVMGLWSYTETEFELNVKYPILLDLLHSDLMKTRSRREQDAVVSGLDKNRIEKSRKDKNRVGKPASLLPLEEPLGKALMARYCELWKSRYGVNPAIQKHHPKLLKDVGEQNGKDRTLSLIEAYFECPDSWFVKKGHDIPTFVGNLSGIARFLESGKVISNNELRQMDNGVALNNTLNALREGKI